MDLRFSAHGASYHLYHLVWIPKYRKPILKEALKAFVEQRLLEIQQYHPDVVIET